MIFIEGDIVLEVIDKNSFISIVNDIKEDIKSTRFKIIENANKELLNLYFRLGKVIDDNWKYGNSFVNQLSIELKLEFPNMKGFSSRNLRRMRIFYNEYKNVQNWPMALANLSWSHNYTLIEKVKNMEKRIWYARKCMENGWSHTVMVHQIDSNLYERQKENIKLTNFDDKMSISQSELARDILKDPYIFELSNLKENACETDIENAMVERIKNVLVELGKGFSFVGNQYKISSTDASNALALVRIGNRHGCRACRHASEHKFQVRTSDYCTQGSAAPVGSELLLQRRIG